MKRTSQKNILEKKRIAAEYAKNFIYDFDKKIK